MASASSARTRKSKGPLAGLRVVELAGIGPAPFCCMLLADMGADVIRVDRTAPADIGVPSDPRFQLLNRGRRSLALDLKKPEALTIVRNLIKGADALVEGFRPGVTERMGLGPEDCLALQPALVYGRMTGWGQDGPLSQVAAHDINYIAITGALDMIGPRDGPPVPPLNFVGDFGGGALYLAFGMACALLEARSSSKGQVVDAAIVDGTAHMLTSAFGMMARNDWSRERGVNLLAGGRPWYGVYQTKDEQYITLGAVEDRFFAEMIQRLGLPADWSKRRHDPANWPELAAALAAAIATRTRDECTALLDGTDACYAPVLNVDEAQQHPHLRQRGVFVENAGVVQPAPAPRFSRTVPRLDLPPPVPGQHSREVLAEMGYSLADIDRLLDNGVTVCAQGA